MPTTPEAQAQRRVIERAIDILVADDRVLAAFLVGSHADGTADRFSDVDVHCVVRDVDLAPVTARLPELVAAILGPTVLCDVIPGLNGALGVTADWLQLDLVVHPESTREWHAYPRLRSLFDHAELLATSLPPRSDDGRPFFPAQTVRTYLYLLGKLATVLGRDELVLAHGGLTGRRDLLIELMLAQTGARRQGGRRRLRRHLTEEQHRALLAAPAAGIDRDQIIAVERYLAAEFVARGRALATATATPWPQALQDATRHRLLRHLGVDFFPADPPSSAGKSPRRRS